MCINKRLGKQFADDATIDEALVASELNFEVKMVKGVSVTDEDDNVFFTDREVCCCRTDNNRILGVHKSRYRPLQNRELFEIGWSAPDTFKPTSAIGFDEGRRPTIYLEGEERDLGNNDVIVTRMVIENSHDGTCKLRATPTVYRKNGDILIPLRYQYGKSQRSYGLRHDGSMEQKMQAMKDAIIQYRHDVTDWVTNITKLRSRILSRDELIAFWGEIYSKMYKVPVTPEEKAKSADMIRAWETTFAKDTSADVNAPDLWAATAAVVQDIQHADPIRRRGDWETKRIEKNTTGESSEKAADLFQLAMGWLS